MTKQALVVGGGIGGLAAALACARAGWEVRLFEQAERFGEVGAGIQLGPNVTRVLADWGLGEALAEVAAFPARLVARSAASGAVLATRALGERMRRDYGAPYATVHRADLHGLLLHALQATPGVHLNLGVCVQSVEEQGPEVLLRAAPNRVVAGDALIGADGLWSRVRATVTDDAKAPTATGHVAFRALVPRADWPDAAGAGDVTVWLGPRLHVVAYPVRRGEQVNVVAIAEGRFDGDPSGWDHGATAQTTALLEAAFAGTAPALRVLLGAAAPWRLWALSDRPPLVRPEQMARGRLALLGDAAHPMRPYLAQGAGMAIEDADELARVLAQDALDVPTALRRYALNRWQRSARVQACAVRNGRIFHADGPVRWGRDLALRLVGEKLLDVPWLYRGPGY